MVLPLILFNVVHWLADFTPLSTKKMLAAKAKGYPLSPILCHALVHAILFFIVALLLSNDLLISSHIFMLQLSSHFVIDTVKGLISRGKCKDMTNVLFWTVLGFDQMLHQFIIIISAYYIS